MWTDEDGVQQEPDDADQYDEEYVRAMRTHGHDATEYDEEVNTGEDDDE